MRRSRLAPTTPCRQRGVMSALRRPGTAAGPGGPPLLVPQAPTALPARPHRFLCEPYEKSLTWRNKRAPRRASRAARPRCYTRQGRASQRARAAARLCNAVAPKRRTPEERGDARRASTTRAHLRATITRGDGTRAEVPRRKRTEAAPSPTKTTAPRPTNGTTRRAGASPSNTRTASAEKASATRRFTSRILWSRLTEKIFAPRPAGEGEGAPMHLPQPCVFLRRCDTVSWCKKTGAGAWLKKGWVCSLVYAIVLLACAFAAFACCRSRSAQRQASSDLLRSLNVDCEDATLPSLLERRLAHPGHR